jgi:hypothetical protein
MRLQLSLALIVFGLSSLLTQKVCATQVLVVASNGKWSMKYKAYGDINLITAQAMAACKAKGGTDPKVVWYQFVHIALTHEVITHGAIAVSDNGTGTIVGWSFNNAPNSPRAREDCRRKGGKNPKVVARF